MSLQFQESIISSKQPRRESGRRRRYRTYVFFLVLLILAASALKFGPRIIYSHWGYLWQDKFENPLTEKQMKAIQGGLHGFKGKVLWSSNRTGNHEIFLMTLPEAKVVQLTHHPHVDTFPRFSPDGRQILFCRSQPRWISQRNLEQWDVYLLSLNDNKETLLAQNAFTPQWLTDKLICYVRKNKLMLLNLETRKEELALDGDLPSISSQMTTPEFLRRDPNLLAVTFRGKMDGVYVWDRKRGAFQKIGSGCQMTWVPTGQEVIWVDNGGNGGNQILKSPIVNPRQSLFMDLPGSHSHEYFPRLSQDGKWLVWAATAEGHEPDVVDYELFLWQVGSPFSQALRLTYNPANDNWPDVYAQ